jgi:hypothetical protein
MARKGIDDEIEVTMRQTAYRIVEHCNEQVGENDIRDQQVNADKIRHHPAKVGAARSECPWTNAARLLAVLVQERLAESLVVWPEPRLESQFRMENGSITETLETKKPLPHNSEPVQ